MKHLYRFLHLFILYFFFYLVPNTVFDMPYYNTIHAQATVAEAATQTVAASATVACA